MKCVKARQRLTLHVSGDLPKEHIGVLEQHLHDCAMCRSFRDELVLQRELMAKLNAPPVPEPNFAGIIQHHEASALWALTWRQRIAGFIVASIIVSFTLAWTWESETVDENALLTQLPREVTPKPAISLATQTPIKQLDSVPVEVIDTSPTVITLYTDDPDVVIHWFGD